MKLGIIRLSLAAGFLMAATAVVNVTPAEAQNAPQGSYRQSCRNIQMESRDDLVAECRRQNGNWRYTKIDIDKCRGRPIVNNNGHLQCGDYRYEGAYGRYQMPGGSWQQTCRNARIVRDDLTAECRERDGEWRRDSIDLDECRGQPLHNENGRLRCGDVARTGYTMPRGTWQQTCRNAVVRGDDLYAQCRGRDGAWHNTRIDLDRCPRAGLRNDNGELRCNN